MAGRHVGHAYNCETLLGEQSEALEAALWTAVPLSANDRFSASRLAAAERRKGNGEVAVRFEEQAR